MHYRRLLRGQDLTAPSRYGGVVKYQMAHDRVKASRGLASEHFCANNCGSEAKEWSYDGTDPTELWEEYSGCLLAYSIHPEFYRPLCVRCHRHYDLNLRNGWRKECSKQGCNRPAHAKGLCGSHYELNRRVQSQTIP